MNEDPLHRIADAVERIADHFDPPAEPGPRTAEGAHKLLIGRVSALCGAACDAEGRSIGVARGFLAKKVDAGRRAALARDVGALHAALRALESDLDGIERDARLWREKPGIAAPMARLLPMVAEFVRETVHLVRARVSVACTAADPSILAALGVVAMEHDEAGPPAGAAMDLAPEPAPAAQPDTQAERPAPPAAAETRPAQPETQAEREARPLTLEEMLR